MNHRGHDHATWLAVHVLSICLFIRSSIPSSLRLICTRKHPPRQTVGDDQGSAGTTVLNRPLTFCSNEENAVEIKLATLAKLVCCC